MIILLQEIFAYIEDQFKYVKQLDVLTNEHLRKYNNISRKIIKSIVQLLQEQSPIKTEHPETLHENKKWHEDLGKTYLGERFHKKHPVMKSIFLAPTPLSPKQDVLDEINLFERSNCETQVKRKKVTISLLTPKPMNSTKFSQISEKTSSIDPGTSFSDSPIHEISEKSKSKKPQENQTDNNVLKVRLQNGVDSNKTVCGKMSGGNVFNYPFDFCGNHGVFSCVEETTSYSETINDFAQNNSDSSPIEKSSLANTPMPNKPAEEHNVLMQENKHKCSECGKTFKYLSALKKHCSSHDKNRTPYICEICGKKLFTDDGIVSHVRLHIGEMPFVCTTCGKKFANVMLLKRHEKRHKDDWKSQCDICGKKFLTNDELRKHHVVHSEIKPFECTICKKKFSLTHGLTLHMKVHSGLKPFKCTECGNYFKYSSSLKEHMLRHENKKDFECNICEKKFPTNSLKNKHVRASHGEKRIACEICGKKFTTNEKLKQHLICHSKAKPYQCNLCGKEFSRKAHMNRHKLIHSK